MTTDKTPERPSRIDRTERDIKPQRSFSPLLLVVASVVVAFMVMLFYTNSFVVPKMVTRADFNTNVNNINDGIAKAQLGVVGLQGLSNSVASFGTQLSQLDSKINAINQDLTNVKAGLGAYAKADSINSLQTSLNNIQSTVNSLKSDVDKLKQQVDTSALTKSINDLKAQVDAVDARLKVIETPSSDSSSKSTIPGVNMSVSIMDEGVIQSDNSTLGQIKLTLTNTGSKDIVDIVMGMYIYLDNCGFSNQSVSSSYGSWYVRIAQPAQVEIRSKNMKLDAGQKRNIYIDVKSWGNLKDGGEGSRFTTYLDVSNSDLNVINWDYTD